MVVHPYKEYLVLYSDIFQSHEEMLSSFLSKDCETHAIFSKFFTLPSVITEKVVTTYAHGILFDHDFTRDGAISQVYEVHRQTEYVTL